MRIWMFVLISLFRCSTSSRNAILLRPVWTINNRLNIPLVTQGTGRNSIRGLWQVIFPVALFLDSLFDEKMGTEQKRSIEDDQYKLFKALESALAVMGVDGRSCMLRTICEMQRHPIGEMTMIGEIITIMLTPKRGRKEFLRKYVEAEDFGREENASIETCGFHYPKCPVSLFNIFRSWSGTDNECEPIYSVDGVELQVPCDDNEDSYVDDGCSSVNLTVSQKWHE
ncbi:uncharacterized protein LOC136028412 [Artemia franciscana]|uniref:uncharacterized protein LOC136028412 n=1 Tax=Artemia franciscana TaxID=6661 RepID=UPI0032D9D675